MIFRTFFFTALFCHLKWKRRLMHLKTLGITRRFLGKQQKWNLKNPLRSTKDSNQNVLFTAFSPFLKLKLRHIATSISEHFFDLKLADLITDWLLYLKCLALSDGWVQICRQGQQRKASGSCAEARRRWKSWFQLETRAKRQKLARRHQHQTRRTRILVSFELKFLCFVSKIIIVSLL